MTRERRKRNGISFSFSLGRSLAQNNVLTSHGIAFDLILSDLSLR